MTAAHAQHERKKKWPWLVTALVLVFVLAGLFGDEDSSPQEVATLPAGLTDLDSATARDRLQEQGFTVTIESVDGRMVIIESNWNVVSASLRDGNDVLLRVAKPTTERTTVPATSKPAPVPTTEPPAIADIPAPVETPPTSDAPEPPPNRLPIPLRHPTPTTRTARQPELRAPHPCTSASPATAPHSTETSTASPANDRVVGWSSTLNEVLL